MKHHITRILLFCLPLTCIAEDTATPSSLEESLPREVKIVGSDLLQNVLSESLTQYATDNGITLDLELIGSIPAIESLKSDDADLGIIAVPDDGQKISAQYKSIPFAFQVAVVAVKDVNPITEITFPQLAGIYGSSSDNSLTRWNEIGLTGVWSSRPIQPLAVSEEDSVVFELFKHKVLNQTPAKSTISVTDSLPKLADIASTDGASIAIVGRLPKVGNFKALSVSSGVPGEFAFGPTPENVYYGDYAMRLPIYLVYKEEKKEKIREFLHLLLSQEISEVVENEDLMPIPGNVRRRTILELDIQP